jgi:ribose 5-phosphate isomerase B
MRMDAEELRAVARRAAGRALADQGRMRQPAGEAPLNEAPSNGVRVEVGACSPARPHTRPQRAERRGGPALVTVGCLKNTADGGNFPVPDGARITPLARDEAFQRGIRFGNQSGAQIGGATSLRIAVGSDHGGFGLKSEVIDWLRDLGHRALDLGTLDTNSCDYPQFARAVAEAVADGRAHFGVCVDGAGIGSAMAANKVPGVLAANCWNEQAARNAREHNHANVLTLGSGMLTSAQAHGVLRAFLGTAAGEGRHARRADLIRDIEQRYTGA